jgi:superfamily I DNA/RNA helicase
LCRKIKRTEVVTIALKQADFPVCHFRDGGFDIFENDLKVITIHSAKGLEFPVVILMDMNEGDLPRDLAHVSDPEDKAAALRLERQLLYVGMTRAADELYLISVAGKVSSFLKDIPAELLTCGE